MKGVPLEKALALLTNIRLCLKGLLGIGGPTYLPTASVTIKSFTRLATGVYYKTFTTSVKEAE